MKIFAPVLIGQEEEAVQTFVEMLRHSLGSALHGMLLYGSKARNEPGIDSDVDLLVIVQTADWSTRNLVSHIAARISLDHDVLLAPHVVSLSRWQAMGQDPFMFYQNVFQEGIPLLGLPSLFTMLRQRNTDN